MKDPAVKAEYDSLTTHNEFIASLAKKRCEAIENRAAEIFAEEITANKLDGFNPHEKENSRL